MIENDDTRILRQISLSAHLPAGRMSLVCVLLTHSHNLANIRSHTYHTLHGDSSNRVRVISFAPLFILCLPQFDQISVFSTACARI